MTAEPVERVLTGWGRTMPSRALVLDVAAVDDVVGAVVSAGSRGVLARGAGRAYGDAAQNGGGLVLQLPGIDGIEVLDDGDVIAGGGALLADVIPHVLARGRFLPVTPGTRYVTVGGAVAADVHGKNHHVDGSFGRHVRWLDVVTADGQVRRVSRESPEPEAGLFHATLGGMGLTGIVVRARFGTIPSPTATVLVDTHRHDDLDSLMAHMVEADDAHRYSVAWVDGTARGRRLGRGVLTLADHPRLGAAGGDDASSLGPARLAAPAVPVTPLRRWSLTAFNELYFRRAPRRRLGEEMGLGPFFYPLDAVAGWNRLYGPNGFLQYQFAVPDSGCEVVRRSLETLGSLGAPSFLTVLKRFGPGEPESPLSFPLAGWTLAIDVPTRVAGLAEALDALDVLVLQAGGRLYLAKDSRATPATIEAGYPGLDRFRAVRRHFDPDGRFTSDLARRLAL